MKKIIAFITLLPLLGSCSKTGIAGKRTYYIDRSFDIVSNIKEENGYADGAYITTSDDIISSLNAGIDILLCTTSTTCNPCNTFKPDYVKFINDTKLSYALIEKNPNNTALYRSEIEKLNNYYGLTQEDENYVDGATPALYLLNAEKCLYFQKGPATSKELDIKLRKQVGYTNTYRTKSYDSVSRIKEDNLVFLFDSSNKTASEFYSNTFKKRANTSNNTSILMDFNLMSHDDKTSILSHFSMDEYKPLLIKGEEIIDIENAPEQAEALIDSSL